MLKIKGTFPCILAMDSYLSFLIHYLLYYIFFLSATSRMYIHLKSYSALILPHLIKFFDSENFLWLMMKLILLLWFQFKIIFSKFIMVNNQLQMHFIDFIQLEYTLIKYLLYPGFTPFNLGIQYLLEWSPVIRTPH